MSIATMTPGDCANAEHDAETIAEIRRGEALASAALIGAELICLEFRDLAIFNDDESRPRALEALQALRRTLIVRVGRYTIPNDGFTGRSMRR